MAYCDTRGCTNPNCEPDEIALKPKADRPKFEAEIQLTDSDWIKTIQYDAETMVLDAHLRNGKRYRYRDVSPLVFARVVTAKSSGKVFNSEVKKLSHRTLPSR